MLAIRCTLPRTVALSVALSAVLSFSIHAAANEVAVGVVFEDSNGNGIRDAGEPGIPGVAVSNGLDVVLTDDEGLYELPITDDTIIFVTKPSGFEIAVDEHNMAKFYYIHKPNGSPDYYHPGVEPTGPLPESIDFPLVPMDESNQFRIVVFADPQPQTREEVYHMQHKVLSELVGEDYRFGVVLGDIMYDHLDLFRHYVPMMGAVGFPFYHVVGNHDINFDAPDNETSTETYQRYFGPVDYSWQSGDVHFITMNNIKYHGRERRGYHTALDENQLAWLRADIEAAGPDKLVVINMHAPLYDVRPNRRIPGTDEVLEMLQDHPSVLVLSGHTHINMFHTFTEEDGWMGDGTFIELNCVTVSGSWWSGPADYMGVPIGIQADGTFPGYTIIEFDGMDYQISYKAGSMPAEKQMSIYPPGTHRETDDAWNTLLVNIFYAPPEATVEYRLNGSEWRPMQRELRVDPLARAYLDGPQKHSRRWVRASNSYHMWEAVIPDDRPRFRPNRWEVRARLPDGRQLQNAMIHSPN